MLNFEKFSIQKATGSALVASAEHEIIPAFHLRSKYVLLCGSLLKKNGMTYLNVFDFMFRNTTGSFCFSFLTNPRICATI